MLADAHWVSDDDRAGLSDFLAQMEEIVTRMESAPDCPASEITEFQDLARQKWLAYCRSCRVVEQSQDELLRASANLADATRNLILISLRQNHAARRAIEEGTWRGTWQQREATLDHIQKVQDQLPELLKRLTADDIRQLREEGII